MASHPDNPIPQPGRSRIGGLALIAFSPIVAVALFFAVLQVVSDYRLLLIGAGVLIVAAAIGMQAGLQLRAPDAIELLRRDTRPPAFFLRPFEEDARRVYNHPVGERHGGVHVFGGGVSASHERALARLLKRVGPFVAAGRPGDRLAPLGAARAYVADDEWQELVRSHAPHAAVIVLQPADIPAQLWQLDLVAQSVDRKRLLLLVPNPSLRPLGFARVRDLVAARLRVELPRADACPPCDAFGFDAIGRPMPIRLTGDLHAATMFVDQLLALGAPGKAQA